MKIPFKTNKSSIRVVAYLRAKKGNVKKKYAIDQKNSKLLNYSRNHKNNK